MAIGSKIFELLNEKVGFETDPDDELATYKPLVPGKIWLYFGKEKDEEGPWFGYWAEDGVQASTREGLIKVLSGFMFDDNAGEVEETGPVIYRTLSFDSSSSETSLAVSFLETMKELEMQTQKMFQKLL
jgi:hypothetical protein